MWGEVLISVLTAFEGEEALQPMATGLMRRYQQAAAEPPVLIYTDRDCCSQSGPSKYQVQFQTISSNLGEGGGSIGHHWPRVVGTMIDFPKSNNVKSLLCMYSYMYMLEANYLSLQILFSQWDGLQVRLDYWHFMKRLGRACTSESHPLYGTFMMQLSSCIFEWD